MLHEQPGGCPVLSVVVPCYNEEQTLDPLLADLLPVLEGMGHSFEIVFVDDGSRDATVARLTELAAGDGRLGIVRLSRNFGKEVAISAGLDHARGEAVIIMDADLQHPPALLPQLVAAWREGYQVIHAAQEVRADEPWLKRLGARAFYYLLSRLSSVRLPKGVGDFCLLDRKPVDALRSLPERARFMKGLYFWVGYRQKQIPYTPGVREAGDSKWSLGKLVGLAVNGLTAFSTTPLRLSSVLGLVVSVTAALYGLILALRVLVQGVDVPGYASLMVALLFLGGVQLVSLGIIGEYIGRIYDEAKNRPLYLVADYLPPTAGNSADSGPASEDEAARQGVVPNKGHADGADLGGQGRHERV